MRIHKRNSRSQNARVSLVLLDWSVRESFHALDWLSKQTVRRDQYEILWVELRGRTVAEVMEKADVVVTCEQKGLYHKHLGYNAGLLRAGGHILTLCDSDAVFPPNFVESILTSFCDTGSAEPRAMVLMHHEQRSRAHYPRGLSEYHDLTNYPWMDLWPNVGACMSVRKTDAIRFGGFDEHRSFRGYLCGPYELGWRLVNAGLPEVWHNESVRLHHFAHAHSNQGRWNEISYPHVDWHAWTAVEAFSTGRLLPLRENPEIHRLRMSQRMIGTAYEEKYAVMSLSASRALRLRVLQLGETMLGGARSIVKSIPGVYTLVRKLRHPAKERRSNLPATTPSSE